MADEQKRIAEDYQRLKDRFAAREFDLDEVKELLKVQQIETPSWAYGPGGTRFKVFSQPGEATNIHEKLADAGYVHKLTGIAPSVALHIPWDKTDDWPALREYAETQGVKLGSINPNVFQEDEYKLGSVTHAKDEVREKAVEHMLECIEIMEQADSAILSIWLADGTNYPGQGNFRKRKRWMEECLRRVHERLPAGTRMLLEYKFFEPGFYHTDIADYGISLTLCKKLGDKAEVLVDLGHHALGVNIEHLVAFLIDEGKLGGFHFNSKKYADDDLTVGSINPYELFLIYNELISGEHDESVAMDVAYMIDQSHNIKPKIEAMIQSLDICQQAYARALLIDREALDAAQEEGDVVGAEQLVLDAFRIDVTPIVAMARIEKGLPPDPIKAHRKSGYLEKVAAERETGGSASAYPNS
ncbi:MAG: L-rhamnose isomerase [Planctomycetes bacterium]|nr:L-rhamnose isomerase [Planctomycetota bacterium]